VGIGISVFLIAVGAILTFAVETSARGIDLDAVGIILMIVGGLGLLASTLFFASWAPWRREETVIHERVHDDPHHHH
jgi:hypothetical protein